MKILLLALLVSSTAYAQTDDMQMMDSNSMEWRVYQLEQDMLIQQYSNQVDRINARQRRSDDDYDRILDQMEVERIMREVERNDGYKWDDEGE